MAARGMKPKPAALKLLAGNPGGRAINEQEPKPAAPIGDCPEWFNAEAREEWQRIVPEMVRLGVFVAVDRAIVEAHCLTYGEVIATAKSGEPLKPALLGQLRYYAGELGLSPTSRARLKSPEQEGYDPTAEFFLVS